MRVENPIFVTLQQKNVVVQEISSYMNYEHQLYNTVHDRIHKKVCYIKQNLFNEFH